jgi:hypothetical protein
MRGWLSLLILLALSWPALADECRDYTSTATIDGKVQRLIGTACRQPDGNWRIMSSRPVRDDHDRARAAVAAGEALPLDTVLNRLPAKYGGKLLDVDMNQAGGTGWQYRLKMLGGDDRVRELTVDAMTGDVLDVREGR